MDAYRKGRQVAFAVKKYNSHRRVGTQAELCELIRLQELCKR